MKIFADKNHNHSKCSAKALQKAKDYCTEKKLNFSPIRQLIFNMIWSSHKSISAYDLLALLKSNDEKIVATTVYRALDFLEKNNLIHKIHKNNTFIGCSFISEAHTPILLICKHCNEVWEIYRENMF